MNIDELENKLEELKKQVKYEEERLKYCAYGKSDIMHIDILYTEIENIENILNESEY